MSAGRRLYYHLIQVEIGDVIKQSCGCNQFATLTAYISYYHRFRTHLSLAMDCPQPRAVEPPEIGKVRALPEVGGLHHHYERQAA